jgi:hypothetical protein
MTTIHALILVWVICGMIAFGAFLLRRRGIVASEWVELSVQFVAAAMLGVVALVGVLTNDDHEG